jgi:hypothetical protein
VPSSPQRAQNEASEQPCRWLQPPSSRRNNSILSWRHLNASKVINDSVLEPCSAPSLLMFKKSVKCSTSVSSPYPLGRHLAISTINLRS